MVRNKKILAIAAVTALLGVTSACGSDDDDPSSTSGGPETADMVVWLNGADTPQAARDWLKETFEEEHPGSTLTIEEQEWDGLVERLTTALSSEDQTPDVVEVGNTQAPTFTTAGAFSDLTGDLEEFGGDDLLPGFVEGATIDGKTYAVPYYAGSTYVFYRKDLFEKAGLEVPTTMDEFVATAIALKADNDEPDFSGYWLPGQDWRDGAAFLWDAGGDFAAADGDEWKGTLSSPESIEGLTTFQTLFAGGVRRTGRRQRGRPGHAVLCRPDRHDVPSRLGHGPADRPGGRLPGPGREGRRLRAARLRRRPRAGAARRLRHRGRRPVAQPGPGRGTSSR